MKKILCLSMIALCMVLSGCHGSRGSGTFEIPSEFDQDKKIEITFWAKNDTNVTQSKIYEKAASDFNKLYPNVQVNIRLYTDYGKIYNDVITNISTNTTPNVCITYPDHIATYLTGNETVVKLDDLMKNEKYGLAGSELKFDGPSQSQIVPSFLNECRIGENFYALPFMRSTEACYINKTYVEAMGYEIPDILTWDFIWEVSEAATKKDADGNYLVNGQKTMIPFIYKSTDNMMISMLKQKNAGYSDENGNILIFNDTTREILRTVAEHAGSYAFSTFKISSYPGNFLNAGQCLFAIDSTAGASWMGSDAPLSDISEDKIVDFETVVRPIPQFDTSNPKMISQGPSVCIFNKQDPQEVLASWLFAQFLLTNETQIAYAQTEGYIPVTTKAGDSKEYRDYLAGCGKDNNLYYDVKIKAAEMLMANTENTFVTPVFNGSTSLRDAAGQMIENTAKAVRRKQTADDKFFDSMFDDMVSLYHLDQISMVKGGSDLGPLPGPAVALIVALITAWVIIIGINVKDIVKKRRAENNT
ncbi:MAG: extracellular solute-binding protein [Lachnospiraceae bacterium]|nr:extracellular solute-binding protein [Lachnospiraceae bacterium]